MSLIKEIELLTIEPEDDITLEDYIDIYRISKSDALSLMFNGFKAGFIKGRESQAKK